MTRLQPTYKTSDSYGVVSLHLTCMPCPCTLCSCSWMCLSSSCCRWMLAWISLVLCSSCSFRCCMAFTCAENSITGCGWRGKEKVPYFCLCVHAVSGNCCFNVHSKNLAKEQHRVHSGSAANDYFIIYLSSYYFLHALMYHFGL